MDLTTSAAECEAAPPTPAASPRIATGPAGADGRAAPVRVTERCQGCGSCLLTCPERAIRPNAGWTAGGGDPLRVLADACTGCGECVEVCPVDAIEELP